MIETPVSPQLAERVSEHLGQEEQCLTMVLDAVRQLHTSLRLLDGEALAEALQNESAALREAEAMQRRRQTLSAAAASEMGLAPDQFTLGVLARRTEGPLRQAIVQRRDRLAELSSEMDRLNQQNAAMTLQSLMLIRGVVGRLTKTAAPSESYNASGVRQEAHVGPLVQWGG